MDALGRRKSQLCQYMARNSDQMEGMLGVTKLREKGRTTTEATPAMDYVRNFSLAADSNIASFM